MGFFLFHNVVFRQSQVFFFFISNHQVDISLYLIETTALRSSKVSAFVHLDVHLDVLVVP